MKTSFRRPREFILSSLYAHGEVISGQWYYRIFFNTPVEGYDLIQRSLVRFDPSVSDQQEQQACFRHVPDLDPPLFLEASGSDSSHK